MPVELQSFAEQIQPSKTVLLFGAGSSIPSGAPSVAQLQHNFERVFSVSAADYKLPEQTGIIEQRTRNRRAMIEELQSQFRSLKPTGGLLNLPLYNWKSIYTTNYDELIETVYQRRERPLKTYSTNFDFTLKDDPNQTEYFKLHGTISKDICFGDRSRIIITEADYDATDQYREQLFDRLKSDIGNAHLVIIGHSLADEDIRSIVNRALSLKAKSGLPSRISLLLYTRDEGRASLWEARGVEVVFGGLDDFFAGLISKIDPASTATSPDPLDRVSALRPMTLDAAHALASQPPNVGAMYNGWPATFGDIASGLTFRRRLADEVVNGFRKTEFKIAIILGPSGVGKTTCARQVLQSLSQQGFFAWQHNDDQTLLPARWREVANYLQTNGLNGVLLIDEAHAELTKINELVEGLERQANTALRLVLVSTNRNWAPRIKSQVLFKAGRTFHINKVSGEEIDRLLDLVERSDVFRPLVEDDFAGYSRQEKRRRLVERCEADMFVCLKNIFSSDSFDNIILREYAGLDPVLQETYKVIAAMEAAGVHVHRQLVIRLLGLQADQVAIILARLEDIIHEQVLDEPLGIYAWRGRHKVIMGIVAEHKYYDTNKRYDLFDRVISNISPTYDIEIRTIRELCNVESGLSTLTDLKEQNVLLRKMISIAPGEKVPRHRLIRNLIELGQFDAADTEIKAFRSDFKIDAPTTRYRIKLAMARAIRSKGLLQEDRIALLGKAEEFAEEAARRYKHIKGILVAYCEVGIEIAKLTGKADTFNSAIELLKKAEEEVGDTDISRMIARLERRMTSIQVEPSELEIEDTIED
jgi:SIR2-like domain/ATPase family associated with various cellular activities (AAA)